MNPTPRSKTSHLSPAGPSTEFLFGLSLALLLSVLNAPAATLSGNVSNVATGNLLEGARVAVPALGLSALSDNTGR